MKARVHVMLKDGVLDPGEAFGTYPPSSSTVAPELRDFQSDLSSADIVLESIPPTTQQTAQERPSYVKENILAYNSAVKELAVRKGVYFLDVYASVVGPDGYLPEAIAAADGIHFQPSGYQIWKDYLKTHVIQGEASYSLGADGAMQFTRSQTAATDAAQPAATDAAQPAATDAAQPAANGAAQPAA